MDDLPRRKLLWMELDKAVGLFLNEYKPSTRDTYARTLAMLARWLGADRPVESITPAQVLDFWQQRIVIDRYAISTRLKHLKTLRTFFNWAVRMQLIDASPARVVRGYKLKPAIDKSKAMNDDELATLLDYAKWKPQIYALVLFLADTGCRRGGAAGLRISDINWGDSTATVTEKGDVSRQVLFGPVCKRALEHWLAIRSAGRRRIRGVHVFSVDGHPIRPDNLSLMFRRACIAAGIRSLGPHSLRHRKGHQMADARIAPSVAATALGHSDPVITLQSYYPRDWERAKQALADLAITPETRPSKVIKLG